MVFLRQWGAVVMSLEQEIRMVLCPWTQSEATVREIISIVQRAVEAAKNGHQKKAKAIPPANPNE